MKRFVLFMIFGLVSSSCASAGFGFGGVNGVIAANQAMIGSIASQAGWYGQPVYGTPYGNVPVCRAKDLVGLTSGTFGQSQPVLVRVDKSKGHRAADIFSGATIVGGIVYLNSGGDLKASAAGTAVGGGAGLVVSNHEPYELCLLLPAPKP